MDGVAGPSLPAASFAGVVLGTNGDCGHVPAKLAPSCDHFKLHLIEAAHTTLSYNSTATHLYHHFSPDFEMAFVATLARQAAAKAASAGKDTALKKGAQRDPELYVRSNAE